MDTSRDGLKMFDKIVLVTGGCDGIGRGCVNVFGKRLVFIYHKFMHTRRQHLYVH